MNASPSLWNKAARGFVLLGTVTVGIRSTHLHHRHTQVGIDEGCGPSSFHRAQLQEEKKNEIDSNTLIPSCISPFLFLEGDMVTCAVWEMRDSAQELTVCAQRR